MTLVIPVLEAEKRKALYSSSMMGLDWKRERRTDTKERLR